MAIRKILKDGVDTGQRIETGRVNTIDYIDPDTDEPRQVRFMRNHPWANGMQSARLEGMGYTLGDVVPPAPPPPRPHFDVVLDAANAVLNAHLTEAQAAQVTSRLIRILGVAVVTNLPVPPGKISLANYGSLALDWRADVLKERDRAIFEGNDPVWPAWNDDWNVIYPFI